MRTLILLLLVLVWILAIPSPVQGSAAGDVHGCGSGTIFFFSLPATLKDPHATTVPTTVSGARATTTTTTAAFGTLQLNSDPSDASVYIDGTRQGTTPFTLSTLTPGSHAIVLKRLGYQDYTGTVTIPAGGTVQVTWTLVAVTTTAVRQVPATTGTTSSGFGDNLPGYHELTTPGVPGTSGNARSSPGTANISLISPDARGNLSGNFGRSLAGAGSQARVRKGISSMEALVALQMALGKIPGDTSYDMNHDGLVNSADAREILRLSVQNTQGG